MNRINQLYILGPRMIPFIWTAVCFNIINLVVIFLPGLQEDGQSAITADMFILAGSFALGVALLMLAKSRKKPWWVWPGDLVAGLCIIYASRYVITAWLLLIFYSSACSLEVSYNKICYAHALGNNALYLFHGKSADVPYSSPEEELSKGWLNICSHIVTKQISPEAVQITQLCE